MATRRVKRYKRKYQVDPTTLRVKVLLPQMYPRLELALYDLMEVEVIAAAVLSDLAVPSELWDYYYAFTKRLTRLGLEFWGSTLEAEIELLIREFTIRGLDPDVLKAIYEKMMPWLMEKRGLLLPALPPGIYLSTAATPTDFSNFPLVRGSASRRAFWHKGYGYIFFPEYDPELDEAGDIIYNSTSDGENWVKPEIGNPVITRDERGDTAWAYQVDFYYDGTYIYAVVAEQRVNGVVKIKRGTPSDGTITWGPWVTIVSASQDPLKKMYVSITKTANGFFWVAYVNMDAAYYYDVYCVRSTSPNSIDNWENPVLIYDAVARGFRNVAVLPLSTSSVYIIYYNYTGPPLYQIRLLGKTFDGSNVGPQEEVTPVDINNDRAWSAVSDPNYNICVIYQRWETPEKIFIRRRVNGEWEDPIETPIVPAPCYFNGFSLTATSSQKLIIFYNEEYSDPYFIFYYRTWDPSEGFSPPVTLTGTEEMISNYNQEICSNYQLQTGTLIGLWFNTIGPPSPLRVVIVSGLT